MADAPSMFIPGLIGAAAGVVSATALWAYSVFSPRCQFWAPVIRSLPQADAVALTFDDGPDPDYTPRILDALAAQGIRATFFVIGRRAAEHPEIVRRIHAQGHTLANHTFDHHPFALRRSRDYWRAQLFDTQKVIADLTGEPSLLFRPPRGYKTRAMAAAARELRLPVVGWSVRAPGHLSAEALTAGVLKHTTGHDIVVLRDGRAPGDSRKVHDHEALPALLAAMLEKKLKIVPLIGALVAARDDYHAAAERTKSRAAS